MKKYALFLPVFVSLLLLGMSAWADTPEALCAKNPAFAPRIMLAVVQSQLERDHDPALDEDTPENLANKASAQGIAECAADLRADNTIAPAFAAAREDEQQVAWDAYNTACSDHKPKGSCITAEVLSARALNHMLAKNEPSGAKLLVQTCELMLMPDPMMAEWRACVDLALAAHASESAAKACKVSVPWHMAKTGEEAGKGLAACLAGK